MLIVATMSKECLGYYKGVHNVLNIYYHKMDVLTNYGVGFIHLHTSITDNAAQFFCMVGLTLMIVLRLTLLAGMDPPDMTVTFFGIIPPPRDVATVVPVNFA